MIGAYRATLDLVRRAGAEDLLLAQDDLRIDYVDDRGRSALDCPPLPAPLHLLAGLLGLRLPWRVRLDAVRLGLAARFGRRPRRPHARRMVRPTGQGAARAAAAVGPARHRDPERDAGARGRHPLLQRLSARPSWRSAARRAWSSCAAATARCTTRLGRYLERAAAARAPARAGGGDRGRGRARRRRRATSQRAETRDEIRAGRRPRGASIAADAVVLGRALARAARPAARGRARRAAVRGLAGLARSPIVSIEMWLDRVVVDRVMVGLRDCEVEWVFDKGRLYGRDGRAPAPRLHRQRGLPQRAAAERRARGRRRRRRCAATSRPWPARAVTRSLVLREADATFASDPASEALRPGPRTPIRGLFLAGDWTRPGLPATIEGAVRSGLAAARRSRGRTEPATGPRGRAARRLRSDAARPASSARRARRRSALLPYTSA